MRRRLPRIDSLSPFGVLYVATFLLAFHLFLPVYINSSFLTSFDEISNGIVGTIFIVGSVLNILFLLLIDKVLRKIGLYTLLLWLAVFQMFAFFTFAFLPKLIPILLVFVVYLGIAPIFFYLIDILTESLISNENTTGGIRGTVLTIFNLSLMLGPLVAGFIMAGDQFWRVYVLAALFLVPFFAIIRRFRSFDQHQYHKLKLRPVITCLLKKKDLANVFFVQFLMHLFFAWAVIYMPIYLVNEIGFTWTQFGIMAFIYLAPFVFIEYPAGIIADRRINERWLLALGFFIAGLYVSFISFIQNDNFFFWIGVLIMTRVGMSLIEIMSESYFFKHVNGDDNNTISFFRMVPPAAYIVGPLIANLALLVMDFRYLWLIMGGLLLYGALHSLRLGDLK